MKKFLALFFSIALSAALNAHAAPVANNTPGFIKKAADLGPVDPNTVITATAWLKLHNEAQLDTLVQGLHKKGSPNYHKWITQDQFNASFGPTSQEVNSVQNFLRSHGLTVLAVAENNMYVKVEGTVAAIQKAFNVQIDSYKFKGNTYRSNKADPSVDNS
ncbi:MAG TPA: protease pro-enzyme activation domain-containing protein, partial [Pyrinomonadaceae bacterium]